METVILPLLEQNPKCSPEEPLILVLMCYTVMVNHCHKNKQHPRSSSTYHLEVEHIIFLDLKQKHFHRHNFNSQSSYPLRKELPIDHKYKYHGFWRKELTMIIIKKFQEFLLFFLSAEMLLYHFSRSRKVGIDLKYSVLCGQTNA